MDNIVFAEQLIKARAIKYVHLSIVFLATFGWVLPWNYFWWITFVLIPVIKLHWKTNGDVCILTTLENKYRGYENAGAKDQEWFIKRVLRFFKKDLPSDENIWFGMNVIMFSSWLIAGIRLFV